MLKRSERVKLMIKEYMIRRMEGLSNLQIAEKYGVTNQTLYRYLQIIADNNGVTRESLLDLPRKKNNVEYPKGGKKEEISCSIKLEDKFDTLLNVLSEVMNQIDMIINEQEEK